MTDAARQTVAIRHVAFEDLGLLAPLLAGRGHAVRYVEAGLDPVGEIAPEAPDLLVVLGGPIGAADTDAYPFLADELRLIARRLDAGRPVLGICLGAQLMARALGAEIRPAPRPQIGWGRVEPTVSGRASCLAPLSEPDSAVLHWHGDTFDLPDGTTRLASDEVCANQAFAVGAHALGLQFHIEATAAGLERWFVGHAAEIGATSGVTVPGLRAETARHAAAAEDRGRRCLESWLDGAGL